MHMEFELKTNKQTKSILFLSKDVLNEVEKNGDSD